MQDKLVLGVDGGGSSTEAAIGRCQGRSIQCIATAKSGPSNLSIQDWETVTGNLELAIRSAVQAAHQTVTTMDSIHMGLAGFHASDRKEQILRWAQHRFPETKVSVGSDIELVLAAGKHAMEVPISVESIVGVIAGTGSAAFALSGEGELIRTGGWGPLLGDQGSAYAIGLAALRTACELFDQDRSMSDPLVDLLVDTTQVETPRDWPHWSQSLADPRGTIAKLATVIIALADQGESTAAANLVDAAAASLAKQALAVAARLPDTASAVAMSGGLFIHAPRYAPRVLDPLQSHCPQLIQHVIVREPVLGALALTQRH